MARRMFRVLGVAAAGAVIGSGITLWQTDRMLRWSEWLRNVERLSWEERQATGAYQSATLDVECKVHAVRHFALFLEEFYPEGGSVAERNLPPQMVNVLAASALGRLGKLLGELGKGEEATAANEAAARRLRAAGKSVSDMHDVRAYVEAVDTIGVPTPNESHADE